MSDNTMQLIAVAVYFIGMIGIGVYAWRKTRSHEDYMLAGRDLNPFTAALSAGASDMSGWLMMGLPGAIYLSGLIEAWIAIGLTVGAALNWWFIAPRLRAYTEVSRNSITIPSFFENRLRDRSRTLRIASGVIILVFFTFYVSSGMVAGGTFFKATFGIDYIAGMLLVGGVTLAYTLIGGFLGASLTDMVQGVMMLLALVAVPIIAFFTVGGLEGVQAGIAASGAELKPLIPAEVTGAVVISVVSSLAWGLGYVGQPHIIVRFMALKSVAAARPAAWIGMLWMIVSLVGAVCAGFVGIAWAQQHGVELTSAETIVLAMSQALLNPFVAGLVLAAVLAAIMSTISSQLVVTSSALVEDLFQVFSKHPSQRLLIVLGRVAVLVVAVIAMLLAIVPNDTILGLVGFAWAGFGAAFGPIVVLSLFWRKLTNWGALAGMIVGAIIVVVWDTIGKNGGPEIFQLYEIVPGFAMNLIVAIVVSLATYRANAEIDDEFTETGALVLMRPGDTGVSDTAMADRQAMP